jgi:hypothetical protein
VILCEKCGRTIEPDEARAAGWRYWANGLGELLPFCPRCAERRVEHRPGPPHPTVRLDRKPR